MSDLLRGYSTDVDHELQRHVGKPAERWLFSVTRPGGEKVLFHTPYEYEQVTGALLDQEDVITVWRAKMAALHAKEKWPAALGRHKEWIAERPRPARMVMLDVRELPENVAAAEYFYN